MSTKCHPADLIALWVLLLTLGLMMPASAVDDTAITIEYWYEDQPLEDVEIQLFLVATWQNGRYQLTAEFAGLNLELSDLTSPIQWRETGAIVDAYICDLQCDCALCVSTSDGGTASFQDLAYGVYYVDVSDAPYQEGALQSNPVLLACLPTADVYGVVMEPKVAYIQTLDDEPVITPATPDIPDAPAEIIETPDAPDAPDAPIVEPKNRVTRPPAGAVEDPHLGIPDPNVPRDGRESEIPRTGTASHWILPIGLAGVCAMAVGAMGLGKETKMKKSRKR